MSADQLPPPGLLALLSLILAPSQTAFAHCCKTITSLLPHLPELPTTRKRGPAGISLGSPAAWHWLRVGHMPLPQPIAVGREMQRAHWLGPSSRHPARELLGVGSVRCKPRGRGERLPRGKPVSRASRTVTCHRATAQTRSIRYQRNPLAYLPWGLSLNI